MDTYEDNLYRDADDENMLRFLPGELLPQPPQPPQPTRYACPLCSASLEEHEYHRHLTQRHASEHVYLRVDGQVLRYGDAIRSTQSVRECELVVLGDQEYEAFVQLGEGPQHKVQLRAPVSLLPLIPSSFEGTVHVSVRTPQQTSRVFTIYCGLKSPFHSEPIDAAVLALQRALDRGVEPDWDGFREQWIDNRGASDLEQRYARGHYAYSHAIWLDHRRELEHSRRHAEEAFTLLSPFDTQFARIALGILAIRMNTFDYLRQWKPFVRLQLACAFLLERDLAPRSTTVGSLTPASGSGIYADSFVETYLDALLAFYANDTAALDRCLVALEHHELRSDINNAVKYNLLQARALARIGRLREARVFYEPLAFNPVFGAEAQEYLT